MKIFKKLILALLLLGLLLISLSLYHNRPESIIKKISVVSDGFDKIVFRVYYLGFLPVGETIVENKGIEKLDNLPVYHLRAYTKPNAFFNALYKADVILDSYIDKKTLLPLKFVQTLELQGKPKEERILRYDHTNKIMYKDGEGRIILPNTYEPLSLLFLFLKKNFISTGKTIDLNINTNQKNYQFLAQARQSKSYMVKGNNFNVCQIEGKVQRRNNTLRHSSTFTIFLLDKPLKVPILIKIFTNIGPISIRLASQ